MIGIVVVSHSPRLAQAAVELALEMVPGDKPAIAIAAGAGDGVTGTDAVKVAEAIAEVSSPDGVLVMMDLGSAVLSAEMALEFVTNTEVEVRLTSAPFVEGLLAAVVRAAGGASLGEVEGEARGALAAKQSQLGDTEPDAPSVDTSPPADVVAELTLVNRDGLHARPVAMLVSAIAGLEARVTVANRRTGRKHALANSPTALLSLGARVGDVLEVAASGPQAAHALDVVRQLMLTGFGELNAAPIDHSGDAQTAAAVPSLSGPVGVSPGRAVGPVVRIPQPLTVPSAAPALRQEERAAAAARIAAAAASVKTTLMARAARVTGEARHILEATAMLAADPGLLGDARAVVTGEGERPERAVWITVDRLAEAFTAQGGRTAERIADLHDVRNRIVAELLGRPVPGLPDRSEPYVLVARDLAPADTALLDPELCRALVTAEGGPTSHTAILARALGLPAVVAAPAALQIPEGTVVIVDGTTGSIVINPTKKQIAEVTAQPSSAASFDGIGHTVDGRRVQLLANVASAESVADAVAANAEGVGLFRTEFCFLDRADAPSVEEQVVAYRQVFVAFAGKKVIIRTLDAGADKPLAFVTTAAEENPALGIRGFRTSRRRPELLDDQLRAIAQAANSESAEVGVMAPMISTADEAADFARRCASHGLRSVGAMIETPSAAITAEELLVYLDFGSIGSNDLAQYTMAADRLDGDLALLNDPWQPAVLRMMQLACAAGMAVDKPVGVCGEAASDPLLAAVLVGLGATSLSMSARSLGPVAELLEAVTFAQCQAAAVAAAGAASATAARSLAARELVPDR